MAKTSRKTTARKRKATRKKVAARKTKAAAGKSTVEQIERTIKHGTPPGATPRVHTAGDDCPAEFTQPIDVGPNNAAHLHCYFRRHRLIGDDCVYSCTVHTLFPRH